MGRRRGEARRPPPQRWPGPARRRATSASAAGGCAPRAHQALEDWDRSRPPEDCPPGGRPPGGRPPGGRPPGGGAWTAADATCMKGRSRRARGREVDCGVIANVARGRGQVRLSFSSSRSTSPRSLRSIGRPSWRAAGGQTRPPHRPRRPSRASPVECVSRTSFRRPGSSTSVRRDLVFSAVSHPGCRCRRDCRGRDFSGTPCCCCRHGGGSGVSP